MQDRNADRSTNPLATHGRTNIRVKIDRSMKSYRRTSSAAPRKLMRDQFIERLVTIALQRSEAINIKERPDAATLHEPGHTTFFAASEVEEQPPASRGAARKAGWQYRATQLAGYRLNPCVRLLTPVARGSALHIIP
jgi:hypothetical protein